MLGISRAQRPAQEINEDASRATHEGEYARVESFDQEALEFHDMEALRNSRPYRRHPAEGIDRVAIPLPFASMDEPWRGAGRRDVAPVTSIIPSRKTTPPARDGELRLASAL